jgi:hypothetical protein
MGIASGGEMSLHFGSAYATKEKIIFQQEVTFVNGGRKV